MDGSPTFSNDEKFSSVTCFYFTAPVFMTSGTLASNVISCVLTSFFALCSTIGNLLIVIAIWKTASLHKPEYILLGWFAFCDFILGFIAGPAFVSFKAAEITKNFKIYCGARLTFEFFSQVALNVSFALLTFMTIDRYLSLHLHLRYKEVVTQKRITIAVFVAFCVSISMSMTRFWLSDKTFLLMTKSVKFAFLCIIVAVYVKILLLVRRHQLKISQHRPWNSTDSCQRNLFDFARFKKYACTVLFIIVLILVCYVPITVVSFCKVYVCTEKLEHAKILYTFMVTFVFLTTSLHPLVFIWRTREVIEAINRILYKQ